MSFLSLKLDVAILQNNPLAIIMGIEQYKAALATLESDDDNDDERIFCARKESIPSSNRSKKKKRRRRLKTK